MCTNMPAASTTQCQLEVGPQRVAQQQELSRVAVSGIADTPVQHSTRLREANDSWSAIKRRRLKGGVFVRVEIDGERPKQEAKQGGKHKQTTLASSSRGERPRARRRQHASGSTSLLEERLPVRAVVVAVGPIR